jgi:hypothetical protein
MPSSLQGFGSAFVGRRDFWPDGSYVTTEWITALFVPLVPVRSVRVKAGPLQTRFLYVAGGTQRNYVICDEQRPHRKQVVCVYGFIALYTAWVIGALALLSPISRSISNNLGAALLVLIVAVPWILPWYLRERSKRWRPGFK